MKNYILLACVLSVLVLPCPSYSQDSPGGITLTPASPKAGEMVSLSYTGSKLAGADSLECQIMVDQGEEGPVLIEAPMHKEGSAWKGSFTVPAEKARFFAIAAVSGDKVDDNDGNVPGVMVYGADTKPVKGAHYANAYLLAYGRFFGMNFKHKTDLSAAADEIALELGLHPEDWQSQALAWNIALRKDKGDETKSKIHSQADEFYKKNKDNEKALSTVATWYDRTGDSAKAQEVRKAGLEKFPKGEFAQTLQGDAVFKEKDPARMAVLLEKLLKDYPSMEKKLREQYMQNLCYLYVRTGSYDKAADLVGSFDKPDGSLYNEIAWSLIEKGEQLDKATGWAKKGIQLLRNPDPAGKPPMMSVKTWKEGNTSTLGAILDTYGMGLEKQEKLDEAEAALAEAYQISAGEAPDMSAHYIECLVKNKKYDLAFETGSACLKKGKESPEILEQMKTAFALKEGSSSGFGALAPEKKKSYEDLVAEANRIKVAEIRKKLMDSRIHEQSSEFTLKDLSDTPVTLSSLKGKVVVVDFWATWCGPCRSSFPYLQKVYEKYKDNPSVSFLALDTWERLKDYPAVVSNAKKFMADNKYSFPVLVDFPPQVVEKYGVDGIPTKFIIDKQGNIGFKSIGFDGPGMEEELTQQIEILLAE